MVVWNCFGLCLLRTELEYAVKPLANGQWRSEGGGWAGIGPGCGGTVGNQFAGRREKPRGQIWRVFYLISNSCDRIPGEGKAILIRQTLDSHRDKPHRDETCALQAALDLSILHEKLPGVLGAIVFDHDHDGALIDS